MLPGCYLLWHDQRSIVYIELISFSYLNELNLCYIQFQVNMHSHFKCWKTGYVPGEKKTIIDERRTNCVLEIKVQNLDQSLNLDKCRNECWRNCSSSAFTFIKAIHWCSYSSSCELPWVLSCISNSGLICTLLMFIGTKL